MGRAKRTGNIMEEMTVKDMIHALKKTKTALLASGGTEQHGYHLPLSTDYLAAYEIAKEVSRRTGCLAPPPLCYSYSGGKLLGTTDISPQTTTQMIVEIGLSLAEQGVRNIIIFAGHCGTEHLNACKEAGYRIMEQARGTQAAFCPALSLSKAWKELLAGGGEHAGEGETSLMLHICPDLVRDVRPFDTPETRGTLQPKKPKSPAYYRDEFILKRRPKHKPEREAPYKYGVPNDGGLRATKKFGRVLFEEMVETLASLVRRMERETKRGRT
ncbi:MAG: creatininase family protein [Planctomycetes bacterium]|nr:creatininase family protein [Planctomycetota bacterium]